MVDLATNPQLELAFLILFLSFIAAIMSDRLRVGYTTVLIAIGFALSLLRAIAGLGAIPCDNSVILGLVVPTIMFESSMRTRYDVFRQYQKTVWALAIFGVVISAFASGLVLNLGLGLPLPVALTFGVIVAPTDPVSVVNILKRIKAPEGLTTILETEANFNNVPSVILYPIAISLTFNPIQDVSIFIYDFVGGILVGLLVSVAAELLYRLITQP